MNRLFLILALVCLACGMQANLPTAPPQATKTPQEASGQVLTLSGSYTPAPSIRHVSGCYNLRSYPRDAGAANIIGEVCDADVTVSSWLTIGGYVETADGWICGQGLGLEEVCE